MTKADISRPAGTKPYEGNKNELLAYGAKLWVDTSLSSSGALSCSTCHNGYATLQKSFAKPYPHQISMVKQAIGEDIAVDVEGIIQFCLMSPMQAKALPWDSKELAALSVFVTEFQKGYKPK
jgi:cytochrome c peroxidase